MPSLLSEHFSTLLVGGVLLIIIILVVKKLIRDKKKGQSCGCGCSGCPSGGSCHESNN